MSSNGNGNPQQQQQQRRRRSTTTPLPAFTDVTASVTAAAFAARRLPELRQLQSATTSLNQQQHPASAAALDISGFLSGGGQPSSRHLRRRATSFRRRQRYRSMVGRSGSSVVVDPKKKTNDNNNDNDDEDPNKEQQQTKSRRQQRRHTSTLVAQHSTWCTVSFSNHHNTTTPTPAVHWIPTHIWHAKRFFVERLWHWQIPLLHTHRGIRATRRLVQQSSAQQQFGKTLVQDVTWRTQAVAWRVCRYRDNNNKNDHVTQVDTALARILAHWKDIALSSSVSVSSNHTRYGTTMLHETDQYPLGGAIGPVQYLVLVAAPTNEPPFFFVSPSSSKEEKEMEGDTKEPGNNNDNDDNKGTTPTLTYYYYLWTHPAIRKDLVRLVHQHVFQKRKDDNHNHNNSTTTNNVPVQPIHGALSCLQVRGAHAMACLQKSLPVVVALSDDDDQTTTSTTTGTTRRETTTPSLFSVTMPDHGKVTIIRNYPRDVESTSCRSRSNNYGVCGYDLFGAAAAIQDAFLRLVLRGGACPVGYMEEGALQLEAQPPVPVFPRDYPDTRAGRLYWQLSTTTTTTTCTRTTAGTATSTCQDANTNHNHDRNDDDDDDDTEAINEWTVLRQWDYGSTGRIQPSRAPLTRVTWWGEDSGGVVLIRSPFLQPLVDAWRGLGVELPPLTATSNQDDTVTATATAATTTTPSSMKKRRRKTVTPTQLRFIPSPSAANRAAHASYCTGLAQSLTASAAVLCQLEIHGVGTVQAGMPIFPLVDSPGSNSSADNESDDASAPATGTPLGYTTAGSFSPWRGSSHGTAVVAAKALLEALASAHLDGAAVTRRRVYTGQTREMLLVRVGEKAQYQACLWLLV